ncbi:2-oxoglutarate and Fe(II)-dependent oxygenase superfamily protein, partial [Prunus dulcis]
QPSLSSRAKTARRLPELWLRLRAPPATGPVAMERRRVPYLSDPSPRRHGLCWPKIAEERRELTKLQGRRSPPPPPFLLTQAPGTRQARRRDLRRSSELGPGAVACTRHPPPGHLDFRAFWFKNVGENFGIERNIRETLPKFR